MLMAVRKAELSCFNPRPSLLTDEAHDGVVDGLAGVVSTHVRHC